MKKFMIMALILFAFIALAACGGNGDTQEPSTTQNENNPTDVVNEETPAANLPYEIDPPSDEEYTNDSWSDSSSIIERITAVERDADADAASHFYARVISETLVDTGFGMYDDFGGCILVFELENISGYAVTVDIIAMFSTEHGNAASLVDQDIHFEPGQAIQFTHSFGEYAYAYTSHLIIEYVNVSPD